MIVDEVRRIDGGDWVERSARVRWRLGEQRIHVRLPTELAGAGADASPFLPMVLLAAMLRGEDLEVDGVVSERLLRNAPVAAATYAAWRPELRLPAITVAGTGMEERGGGIAGYFSRGVDSTFSAVCERAEPLQRLVFCDGVETLHDRGVASAEVQRARAAAEAIGLPLSVVNTNVRSFTNEVCDWADAHGGALAGIALTLSGLRRVVVPASATVVSVGPYGSSPVLDHLFSTEAVEVQHDGTILSRVAKVAGLAAQRPDLLGHLKVCFEENRPDNCGRCGKCLHTMIALEAAGALRRARLFPPVIDIDAVARMGVSPIGTRVEWEAAMRALPAGELRSAMARAMRRSARGNVRRWLQQVWRWRRGRYLHPHPSWRDPGIGFDVAHHDRLISLLHYGEPFPPLGEDAVAPEQPFTLRTVR